MRYLLICLFPTMLLAQPSALYRDVDAAFKEGMNFYGQGLYGPAQEAFLKTIQTQAPSSQAHRLAQLYYGLALLKQNNSEGERHLSYFIRQHDPDALAMKARLEVGRFYYNEKKYDQAIAYLSGVQNLNLSNLEIAELRFQLGYSYFVKKQFNKAEPLFEQVKTVEKSRYFFPANYYYGVILYMDKRYPEALEHFKIAVNSKLYKNTVPVYICNIYFIQRNYDQVISYARPLVGNKDLDDRLRVVLMLGQAFFERKDYTNALGHLDEYVKASSKVSQEILYQLAYTQYKNQRYTEALQTFEQLNVLESPLGQNALYNMADCYLKTGNKTAARQAFQRAAQMKYDPQTQEDALFNYAKLSYELGFDNDAITALQLVSSASAYYVPAQDLMSDVFLNTRDYDNALRILRDMKQKAPKLKETHQKVAYLRGAQLYRDAKIPQAIELFNEAQKAYVHPETRALTLFWLGEAHYVEGKYTQAVAFHREYQVVPDLGKMNIPDNSSLGVSHYTTGYAMLKQKNHAEAARHFAQCIKWLDNKDNRKKIKSQYVLDYVYPDALLRAADCYLFLNRNNEERNLAKQYYATVIQNNYPNQDYALYQQSLIANLQGNYTEQVRLIDQLLQRTPNSLYADDALYAKGTTLLNNNKSLEAQDAFLRLIQQYPSSEWKNAARIKMGIALLDEQRIDEAIDYYKAVLVDNPSPEDARDAMDAVKEIYTETGRVEDYYAFTASLGYKIDEAERDSAMFKSAERVYQQRQWEVAVTQLSKYLELYPNGVHALQARFYRAESLFDLKRFPQALTDYAFVSDKGNSAFAELANYRAAIISYYNDKNYPKAYQYYSRLEPLASNDQMRFEARQFLMRTAFLSGNLTAVPDAANKFLQEPRASDADKSEAHYYLGKAYQEGKKNELAKAAYQKTIDLSKDDVRAAEARYQIALMFYQERNVDKAMDLCFKTNKEIPNHMYWLVKSFILLADIYAEKGNLFQAKATLQSIVDNYDEDQDLLNEAKRKLESVKQAEAKKSKL